MYDPTKSYVSKYGRIPVTIERKAHGVLKVTFQDGSSRWTDLLNFNKDFVIRNGTPITDYKSLVGKKDKEIESLKHTIKKLQEVLGEIHDQSCEIADTADFYSWLHLLT